MHVSEEAHGRFPQRWMLSSGPALMLLACCATGTNYRKPSLGLISEDEGCKSVWSGEVGLLVLKLMTSVFVPQKKIFPGLQGSNGTPQHLTPACDSG